MTRRKSGWPDAVLWSATSALLKSKRSGRLGRSVGVRSQGGRGGIEEGGGVERLRREKSQAVKGTSVGGIFPLSLRLLVGGDPTRTEGGLLNNPRFASFRGLPQPRFLFVCREIIVNDTDICYDIFHTSIYPDRTTLHTARETSSLYRTDLSRWPMIGGSPPKPTPGTLLQIERRTDHSLRCNYHPFPSCYYTQLLRHCISHLPSPGMSIPATSAAS